MKSNFITGYADIQDYAKNSFIIDYAGYAYFPDSLENISSRSTLTTQIFETVFRHSLHWLRLYSRLGENAHHWLSWLPRSTSNNYLAMYFLQDIECSLMYFTCLQLKWLNIFKCSIFYYLGYFGKSYFSRFQQNEKPLDAIVKRIQRSQWHQKFFLIDIIR